MAASREGHLLLREVRVGEYTDVFLPIVSAIEAMTGSPVKTAFSKAGLYTNMSSDIILC